MSSEKVCDCDHWNSRHRWHCATNYPTPVPSEVAEVKRERRMELLPEILTHVRNTTVSRFDAEEVTAVRNGHTCRCKHHPEPDLDAAFAMFAKRVADELHTWALLGDYDETRESA